MTQARQADYSTSSLAADAAQLKIPPHSKEAERSVLACALSGEKMLSQVVGELNSEDFYEPAHRLIYECIRELIHDSQPVDVITLMNRLSLKGKLETIGGLPYLNELTDAAPSLTNASHYAQIVRQKALMRKLIPAFHDCLACCYTEEKADQVLDFAASRIFGLREKQQYGTVERLGEIVSSVINDIYEQFHRKESRRGISSGFPSLDLPLSGLRPGTLNILAARPAMGKSALAINIAHRVSAEGKIVAYFSLEMNKAEIAHRVLSSQAMIRSDRLSRASELEEKDFDEIGKAMRRLYEIGFYIDDQADNSPFRILSKCRQMRVEGRKLGLIIIDYMQLMQCDGRHDSRQQEISEISRSLKLLAKEMNVPVLALSQLSRACELRQNKRPLLSDLRESGSIEQDADAVLFIYRDSYYQSEKEEGPREEAEIIIAKNRSGSTQTVKLEWLSEYTTFYDPASRRISDADAPPENVGVRIPENWDENPFDDSTRYEGEPPSRAGDAASSAQEAQEFYRDFPADDVFADLPDPAWENAAPASSDAPPEVDDIFAAESGVEEDLPF